MIARLEQSFIEMQRIHSRCRPRAKDSVGHYPEDRPKLHFAAGELLKNIGKCSKACSTKTTAWREWPTSSCTCRAKMPGCSRFAAAACGFDELLLGVVEHMQVLASEKQITLKLECDDASVDGDADRLRRQFSTI